MARQITNEGKWGTTTNDPTATNITTVLKSVQNNYLATIAGLIDRIGDAHEIIQAKAYSMHLNVLADEGDSKPSSNIRLEKDGTHKIMDTASAINSINVQKYLGQITNSSGAFVEGNQTINAGSKIYVPVGYNRTAYTITASGAGTTLQTTNLVADNLIKDTTGYNVDSNKNVTLVRGNLEDFRETDKNITIADNISASSGNVRIKIPETGAYSAGHYLLSNIPYQTPANDEMLVNVQVLKTAGETLVEGGTLPAGYYPNDVKLFPVFAKEDEVDISSTNKRINVTDLTISSTSAEYNTSTNTYTYTAGNNFDYIKQVNLKKAGTFGIQDSTSALTPSWNSTSSKYELTQTNGLSGTVTTAGWTGTTVGKDTSVKVGTLPKATFKIGADGKTIVVDTAGYIGASDAVKAISSWEKSYASIAKTTTAIASVAGGDNSGSVVANHYYAKFNVTTAGYAPVSSHYLDIGAALSIGNAKATATANKTYTSKGTDIASQTVYIDISGKYLNDGVAYISAKVKDVGTPTLTITDKASTDITVGTKSGNYYPLTTSLTGEMTFSNAGWMPTAGKSATDSSVTVGRMKAATLTHLDHIALIDSLDPLLGYHVPVTFTAGYIPAGTISLELDNLDVREGRISLDREQTSYEFDEVYVPSFRIDVASTGVTIGGISPEVLDRIDTDEDVDVLENLTSNTTFHAEYNQYIDEVTVNVEGIIRKLELI